jgi:hypothetical protein
MFHSHNLNRSIKIGLVAAGFSVFVGLPAQAGPYSGGTVGTAWNSTTVEEWADQVDSYNPGPDEIDVANSPNPTFNDTSQALGPSNALQDSSSVVSLGDGGSIILSFASPIVNGSGADFSVFENGFASGSAGQGFLELATVAVSSDGTNFFTFPDVSLTQTQTQVGAFGTLDPTNLYDLAGKTFAGVGTDFDLQELAGVSPLLNINDIQYVKVTDVVGSINPAYGTYDSEGNLINDPWPTPFASSGFDLDAIAVLNDVASAPEPSPWLLMVVGVLAAATVRRFRRVALIASAFVAIPALGLADTVTFTSLTPSTPYDGGGDYTDNTAFSVDGLGFNNSYDPDYGSWAGFAYSNTHDETTGDYTNEFSAEGSAIGTFAVGYVDDYTPFDPTLTLPAGDQPLSISVTNTVYTYQTLLNGNEFATAFGPGSYFILDITGYNAEGQSTGTVPFYLANFLGGNSSIVNNWTTVDLSGLAAGTQSLVFTEQSSDSGEYGINTPEYFALGAVTETPEPPVVWLLLASSAGVGLYKRLRA